MSAKIRTTGELRDFLVDMMIGVKNGHLEVDKASRITKLAAQVTENMYAEIKIAKVRKEAGAQADEFGSLHVGTSKED